MDNDSQYLRFFLTAPHECHYIEGNEATSLFADPLSPKNKLLYSSLVANGFRRSGEHLYRPHCANCQECIPARIPVETFSPRRHQKRAFKLNKDLSTTFTVAEFNTEHFELYRKYISTRHQDSDMNNPTEDSYQNFLWCKWSETRLVEYRLNEKLLAVAVIDELLDGCSAVYTFFDTDYATRSLGKYVILSLIKLTKELGLSYLYLGYWITGCQKMSYKTEYQPLECFLGNQWKCLEPLSSQNFAVQS